MAAKFLKHRWQKRLAIVLLIFIVVISIVAGIINHYWSPILADRVKSTILISTDSLYEADFKKAELHVVQGKLIIHNITLKPNMAVYNRYVKMHIAPNNLYELKVKRLVLKHMHPIRLYFRRNLDIGQIVLSAPELKVTYRLNHTHDTLAQNRFNAWQRIKPILKSIHIKQILLNDVKLRYEDSSGNKSNVTELEDMNLTGNELLIDSTTQDEKSRFYYFKEVKLELNNFGRTSENGLYTYRIKQLQFSTLTSQLQATDVNIIPAAEAIFTAKKIRNRYAFSLDTLQVNNFDFKTYNKYRRITSSSMLLKGGRFSVLTQPQIPPRNSNRVLSFPNAAIRRLKSDFRIDTIELRHININYRAYGKVSHKPGLITFDNTSGRILNVTTNAGALQRNNWCRMEFNTYLMNQGRININANFNLTDSAKSYTYKGTVGTMNLQKLNPVTMPFALVKVASGKLNRFEFDIKGDRRASRGKITFLYNDLKIRILNMDSIRQKYKRRYIVSMMANALIIKDNNPDKQGDTPRSFNVSYVRQPDTPFLKTIWKTLAKGIKASVGYDEATERQVKQHIAQFAIDKKNRRIQKELRTKQRAERKEQPK